MEEQKKRLSRQELKRYERYEYKDEIGRERMCTQTKQRGKGDKYGIEKKKVQMRKQSRRNNKAWRAYKEETQDSTEINRNKNFTKNC